ncbi:MAG: glycerophosphodiester phosphodiesterase [Eubacteriales bacterium]|nr:glycerophosphodiester phosphodiesterase [Eubacteriales bacterium]
MTKVWAHRGASGYAPENTLEAFELAAKQGADGVELDIQLSKDGELVVMHDETVDRVTDGRGRVQDFTVKELKELRVLHPDYQDARIPTLAEVYELLKPYGIEINVEVKTGIYFYPGIEEKALELARRMGMEDRIWYSSFNHATVVRLKELEPSVRTGILYADGWLRPWEYAKEIGADALHPALYNMQFPGYLEESRRLGLRTHVWTVNEEDYMEKLAKAGVEAIITNYPDIARKIVQKYGD